MFFKWTLCKNICLSIRIECFGQFCFCGFAVCGCGFSTTASVYATLLWTFNTIAVPTGNNTFISPFPLLFLSVWIHVLILSSGRLSLSPTNESLLIAFHSLQFSCWPFLPVATSNKKEHIPRLSSTTYTLMRSVFLFVHPYDCPSVCAFMSLCLCHIIHIFCVPPLKFLFALEMWTCTKCLQCSFAHGPPLYFKESD